MAAKDNYTKDDLINLKPRHDTMVCIDSDGCVFDTMEIKQKKCFHKVIVSHWRLEPIEKTVRETAEFTNLYSKWRGTNRFIALLKAFDLLEEREDVRDSGVEIPKLPKLREFVNSGAPLGNPHLEKAAEETGDPELASVLQWSKDVNAVIAETVKNIPPFPWAQKSIEKISQNSDMIVVSQTPSEALVREWNEHDLAKYAIVIAGQELGTKTEHIEMATKGKYEPSKTLMIGDAPGDRKAANANNALFFPTNPAEEDASWKRFYDEAYDKFLAGAYSGEYALKFAEDFEALLPETPPWT